MYCTQEVEGVQEVDTFQEAGGLRRTEEGNGARGGFYTASGRREDALPGEQQRPPPPPSAPGT